MTRIGRVRLLLSAVALFASTVLATGPTVSASGPVYTITPVGPAGGDYRPVAVNSADEIIGRDSGGNPFYVESGTIYHPAAPATASCWYLTGLNESGLVVGYVETGPHCTAPVEAFRATIGPNFLVHTLANTGGSDSTGCAALSVNDGGDVAGVCDTPAGSREVTWTPIIGFGYGAAAPLTLPSGTVAPPDMGSHPPTVTQAIDNAGDAIGQARCSANHRTSVAVIWAANGHGSILGNSACHSPHSNSAPTIAAAVASNVSGGPGMESGPVFVSGLCRFSGTGSGQKNKPCLWSLHYSSGSLRLSSPAVLDSSASKFARAVDVNAAGWVIGAQGNRPNTTVLWLPHGSGHQHHSLTAEAANPSWVLPGPCDHALGAAAMSAVGDIVGTGEKSQSSTGFLMKVVAGPAGTRMWARQATSRRGVSGSGCQS